MRIPLLRGRTITDADRLGALPVVVASEAMVRRWFPGTDALGKRIRLGGVADTMWCTSVGVVGDVRHAGLDQDMRATMYVPHAQFIATLPDSLGAVPRSLAVVIRTTRDPESLGAAVRALVRRTDPDVPVARVRPLDDVVRASLSTPRLATALLLAFGAVVRRVMWQGMRPVLLGLALGATLAGAGTR